MATRADMIERQLVPRGITDERVLRAFARVPREAFVSPALAGAAYQDGPLPIGEGQTISQPFVVALTLQALALRPEDRVLEIGTGSGYAAALLAELVREVYTVERLATLAYHAARTLAGLGIDRVRVIHGDGSLGLPELAPFDAIVVAASAPEVPRALREQLAIGGRLVMPIGAARGQELVRVVREDRETFREESLAGVSFVPLIGEGEGAWQTNDLRAARRMNRQGT